ncbi:hypothetical protein BVC80_1833g163 [Macleaya cordata]|uniref:Uncharacterized protein n=1 Tax=Macleaya cordata TaxID=56857 RepID=A0A200R6X7_MACCD|nr:hypothetical protein BVC80_1833g163 [Macleaya cordata]
MRGFRMVEACSGLSKAARFVQSTRPLCTNTNNDKAIAAKSVRDDDAYRQLEKLDFMTAAKILFTDPPKKKKFGLDFHLVQLFFVCMPSLAVYLVAQYARYEIRRMEAEVEQKKKKTEEEEKAKEMEANALKESEEAESDAELFKVKVRLEALEEAVKEIVVESKKLSSKSEEGSKGEKLEIVRSNSESKSKDGSAEAGDQQSKKHEPGHESVSGSGSEGSGETEKKSSPKNPSS